MLIKLCRRIGLTKLTTKQFSLFKFNTEQDKKSNLNKDDSKISNADKSANLKGKDLDKDVPIKESSINKYFRDRIKKYDGRLN
jgi:hypothetical protein